MGVGESKGQDHPMQYHPLGRRLGHLYGRFRANVVSDHIGGRIDGVSLATLDYLLLFRHELSANEGVLKLNIPICVGLSFLCVW